MEPSSLSLQRKRLSSDLTLLEQESYPVSYYIDDLPPWLEPFHDRLNPGTLGGGITAKFWHNPKDWIEVSKILYLVKAAEGEPSPVTIALGVLALPLWTGRVKPREHWAIWKGQPPLTVSGRRRRRLLAPYFEPHDKGVCVLSIQPDDDPSGLYDDHYDKVMTYTYAIWRDVKDFGDRFLFGGQL